MYLQEKRAFHSINPVSKESIEQQVNQKLKRHCLENFASTEELTQEFQSKHYVKIPHLLPPLIRLAIRGEVIHLLNEFSVRRDLSIAQTCYTPRLMSNVRQSCINQAGMVIPLVYHSNSLISLIARVVGEEVFFCPYEEEKFVINHLARKGDTHGWHWDDYSYTLVLFVESPPSELGGELEFIPNTVWNKSTPSITHYLSQGEVQGRNHDTGDVYIIKANTSLHRVVPLKGNADRIVISMAFASKEDLESNITHETMEEMYKI